MIAMWFVQTSRNMAFVDLSNGSHLKTVEEYEGIREWVPMTWPRLLIGSFLRGDAAPNTSDPVQDAYMFYSQGYIGWIYDDIGASQANQVRLDQLTSRCFPNRFLSHCTSEAACATARSATVAYVNVYKQEGMPNPSKSIIARKQAKTERAQYQ